MVGEESAANTTDTVGAAVDGGGATGEFERFDFTFAPPFGPVWDPVLTARKVIQGKLEQTEEAQPVA